MQVFDSDARASSREHDRLEGALRVGNEFMTQRGADSKVQRSGEFVRIDRDPTDPVPRFCLLHESAQAWGTDGAPLSEGEFLGTPPGTKLPRRSRLFVAEMDNGVELPFLRQSGFRKSSKLPRAHGVPVGRMWSLAGMRTANYTNQEGKRRVFSLGDGRLLVVREVAAQGDARYWYGQAKEARDGWLTKERGVRASTVQLVAADATTGADLSILMSFSVHSGLGFDVTDLEVSSYSSEVMHTDSAVYTALAGTMFGRSPYLAGVGTPSVCGDSGDTYAVAPPAFVMDGNGGSYISLIAVYPAPGDTYDNLSAGPYRLTCKYTAPTGTEGVSTVTFPPIPNPDLSGMYYFAAAGMQLHRTSPTTVVLQMYAHAMQRGTSSIPGGTADLVCLFLWSADNGMTWEATPTSGGNYPSGVAYGGVMVKDKDTLLAFSSGDLFPDHVRVWAVTRLGTSEVSRIDRVTFNAGLKSAARDPYEAFGNGGAVYRKSGNTRTKRLWMQFDPYWLHAQGSSFVLDYPSGRPMLMVSDDGGSSWTRRYLPSEWCFLVGFVVAISEYELAVPVLSKRKATGGVKAAIHISRDGGDTWKKTGHEVALPPHTFADGGIVIGRWFAPPEEPERFHKFEQDIGDSRTTFNRGELHPLVTLRDAMGRIAPSDPARPWMTDQRFQEPTDG